MKEIKGDIFLKLQLLVLLWTFLVIVVFGGAGYLSRL